MLELDTTKLIDFTVMFWAAMTSPGPNLILVLRTAAEHTRLEGFMVALGLSIGILLHGIIGAVGLDWVFKTYPLAIKGIQYIGAAYLAYLGIKGLMAKKKPVSQIEQPDIERKASLSNAFRMGFLTQLFNPFAIMSIISLFSMFYSPAAWIRGLYVAIFFFSFLIWFGSLSVLFTNARLQRKLFSIRHWIDRVTGVILIYFAIKIALASGI